MSDEIIIQCPEDVKRFVPSVISKLRVYGESYSYFKHQAECGVTGHAYNCQRMHDSESTLKKAVERGESIEQQLNQLIEGAERPEQAVIYNVVKNMLSPKLEMAKSLLGLS